jgi:glycosyltransferase involved in cell wall biosynthesis
VITEKNSENDAFASAINVTVCMPVYNGAKYIEEALNSIVCQVFSGNLELLIIDDGSIDDTIQIAHKVLDKTGINYRILYNQTNLGLVGNWNRCLEEAMGEWIQFLFQDDLLLPGCLQKMYSLANENRVPLVLCDRLYIDENSCPRKVYSDKELLCLKQFYTKDTLITSDRMAEIAADNFLGQNFLGEPIAGMFRRDIINEIGMFNPLLKQACDFEFWLRIALNYTICYTPEQLVKFRVHNESTSKLNQKSQVSRADRIIIGSMLLRPDGLLSLSKYLPVDSLKVKYRKYVEKAVFICTYKGLESLVPNPYWKMYNKRRRFDVKSWFKRLNK